MTEEAPAGSSEGATWALRHRKALASALFVLAAIAALKAPGLRITAPIGTHLPFCDSHVDPFLILCCTGRWLSSAARCQPSGWKRHGSRR